MVKAALTVLAVALACTACGDSGSEGVAENVPDIGNRVPPAAAESAEPGQPGGLPDDRTPLAEGPIDPKSADGAGQVLQRFGGLLEQRKFAEAYRLWSDAGRASGMSEAEFIATYDKYAEIHSEVGKPGGTEGAAGSIYVDIPFRLYGKLNSGAAFNQVGTATLRRVNDVPGSSEEQRRWHLYRIYVQPSL